MPPTRRHLALTLAGWLAMAPAGLAQSQPQAPPIKIALIGFSRVVRFTNEGQRAVDDTLREFTPKKTELEALYSELESLKKQLQTGNWSATEIESRQGVIDQKQQELARQTDEATNAYQAALQKAFEVIAAKVLPVAANYAQQSGFTVLLDAADDRSLLWAIPSSDITQAVTQAYDAGSGATQANQGQSPSQTTVPMAKAAKAAVIDLSSAVFATNDGKKAMQDVQSEFAHAAQDAYNEELQKKFNVLAQKFFPQLTDYASRNGYTIVFYKTPSFELKLTNLLWLATGIQIETLKAQLAASADLTSTMVEAFDSMPAPPAAKPAPTSPQVAETTQPAVGFATNASEPSAASDVLNAGKFYALVIGINQYPQPLPQLATAVADAKAVAKVLHDQYGFEVTTLLDTQATRANVLEALYGYRSRLKPEDNDNLLIYYAGHGYYDRGADKAYWLPIDADSAWSPNRISADDLTSGIKAQPARHVLVISNSCYSGDLSRDPGIIPRQAEQQAYFTYLEKMLDSRSRTIMASGGDEPVADGGGDGHSVFACALLQALQHPDSDMFAASDLFTFHVKQRVGGNSDQQPRYDIIRNSGHEEGDFVFGA